MKQAVIKLALKVEELLKHESHEARSLGARIMVSDTVIIFHSEGIINDDQMHEAMSEIDLIYPVK